MRDPEAWRSALEGVRAALAEHGLPSVGAMASPVMGPAGNVEFFLHARAGGDASAELGAAVDEGIALRERSGA